MHVTRHLQMGPNSQVLMNHKNHVTSACSRFKGNTPFNNYPVIST